MENSLTKLEKQVLSEIKAQDGNGEYILESDFKEQYLSILSITIPYKVLRGVLSSLIKKDYIEVYQEDDNRGVESVIKLKQKAIDYYQY